MIKKNLIKTALLVIAAAALMMGGCGKKAESGETTVSQEAATESDAAADGNTESTEAEDSAETDAEIEALKNVKKPDSLGTITLGAYDGIEISTDAPYTITDEDVDGYIGYYILPGYIDSVEDAAKDGDTVNIDYVGKKDGVAFDGGTASGYDLVLGSQSFIDGFEDGLIGAKKGETRELNLTFPENYGNEELAGADVVFEVTVNDVKRVPELTDALAEQIDSETKTAAAYREKIRDVMQQNEDHSARQTLAYQAINTVVENSEITVAQDAVDWKVADLIANYYDPMMKQSYGMGLSQMLAMQGQTLDEFKSDLSEVAEETVKQMLVMDAIAAEQNFQAEEADLQNFADRNNLTLSELQQSVGEEDLRTAVLEDQATDYVVDHAKVSYTASEETGETEAE